MDWYERNEMLWLGVCGLKVSKEAYQECVLLLPFVSNLDLQVVSHHACVTKTFAVSLAGYNLVTVLPLYASRNTCQTTLIVQL